MINKDEVWTSMKVMSGKTVGPDDMNYLRLDNV